MVVASVNEQKEELHMQEPASTTPRQYERPAQVIKRTGLSKSTVMAAIWGGELEAYRVGRAWIIPIDATDQWIEKGRQRVA